MALENDGPRFQSPSFDGIVVWLASIGPIGHLKSIDPDGDSWTYGHERLGKPLMIYI